ncbi:hypothetical protein [Variovorax saccharolyticus]|uniref:hypothetical protein n=1 Tax=Variovorax saccharolyticus TaxID=3053516 RepID=UPI0025774543|nr:hypothetical protein [Variovorax sp. J22R187]MDM0018172.1 hypothetical protein [Variovorax sp. J22R187]
MTDQSHLDSLYFIDNTIYNCPYCNRRHVTYAITSKTAFDWTKDKQCWAYFAYCRSCNNTSMHLSFQDLKTTYFTNSFSRFDDDLKDLDSRFFFSVPTSFFVLDDRIPSVLRDLITEADGCLKSNFLTGASACARKLIYELAKLAKVEGANYEDRVKALKEVYPAVDGTFFDTLLSIQSMTSTKVHENALDNWAAKHLRVMLASIREVLHEIYVVPALRADRRKQVLKLQDELMPKPKEVAIDARAAMAARPNLRNALLDVIPKEPSGPSIE